MARFPILLWRLYMRQSVVLNALIIELDEELRYWMIMYSLYFCGISKPPHNTQPQVPTRYGLNDVDGMGSISG